MIRKRPEMGPWYRGANPGNPRMKKLFVLVTVIISQNQFQAKFAKISAKNRSCKNNLLTNCFFNIWEVNRVFYSSTSVTCFIGANLRETEESS